MERITVTSTDGAEISVQKAGSGPALLLIHGALLNGMMSWGAVLPIFREAFTVYIMDRRGRAPSGDAEDYSIEREADDIGRVIEAIGGPVIVLGHSYGARAALEALGQLDGVSHLIIYEPPITFETTNTDALTALDQALAAGDREGVVTAFLARQIQAPPERIEMMKSSPMWPVVLEISPTLPRESRAVNMRRLATGPLANWEVPTTILLGSETAGMLRDAAFFVERNIPGSRIVILEGQGHGAPLEAPEYFAEKVMEVIVGTATPNHSSSHTAG